MASDKLRETVQSPAPKATESGTLSESKELEGQKPILSSDLSGLQENKVVEVVKEAVEKVEVPDFNDTPETTPEAAHLKRSMALSCLDAVHQAMELLEAMEQNGKLQKIQNGSSYIRPVVDLHDKLELYVAMGAPGEVFVLNSEDIHAAALAADLLEMQGR